MDVPKAQPSWTYICASHQKWVATKGTEGGTPEVGRMAPQEHLNVPSSVSIHVSCLALGD